MSTLGKIRNRAEQQDTDGWQAIRDRDVLLSILDAEGSAPALIEDLRDARRRIRRLEAELADARARLVGAK